MKSAPLATLSQCCIEPIQPTQTDIAQKVSVLPGYQGESVFQLVQCCKRDISEKNKNEYFSKNYLQKKRNRSIYCHFYLKIQFAPLPTDQLPQQHVVFYLHRDKQINLPLDQTATLGLISYHAEHLRLNRKRIRNVCHSVPSSQSLNNLEPFYAKTYCCSVCACWLQIHAHLNMLIPYILFQCRKSLVALLQVHTVSRLLYYQKS